MEISLIGTTGRVLLWESTWRTNKSETIVMQGTDPALYQCWSSVGDAGPTLIQHYRSASDVGWEDSCLCTMNVTLLAGLFCSIVDMELPGSYIPPEADDSGWASFNLVKGLVCAVLHLVMWCDVKCKCYDGKIRTGTVLTFGLLNSTECVIKHLFRSSLHWIMA